MRWSFGVPVHGLHLSASPARITKVTLVLRINDVMAVPGIPKYPPTPWASANKVAPTGMVKVDGSDGGSIFRDPVR
jgi:hypothetical protein